jgi:hypothetical protein
MCRYWLGTGRGVVLVGVIVVVVVAERPDAVALD